MLFSRKTKERRKQSKKCKREKHSSFKASNLDGAGHNWAFKANKQHGWICP